MTFQSDIINAIRQVMPADAQIQLVDAESGFNVGVSWKLNDDPERPNKMSKIISVRVSHEAAQDFASASELRKEEAYRRLYNAGKQRSAAKRVDRDVFHAPQKAQGRAGPRRVQALSASVGDLQGIPKRP